MSKEKTVEKEKPVFEEKLGLTLYSDAGTRPNPGFGGVGIHGYLYTTKPTPKGVGLGTTVPCSTRYEEKFKTVGEGPNSQKVQVVMSPETAVEFHQNFLRGIPNSVTVKNFVDGCTTMAGTVTNNECEATAIRVAMEYALEKKVDYLQVVTDSKYALKGTQEWMHSWARNNWRKSDGTEVSNVSTWIKVYEVYNKLVDSGTVMKFDWVRGHSGELGNTRADFQATVGLFRSVKGETKTDLQDASVEGYWNSETSKHPFVNHRFIYFNTRQDACKPGVYYQGNQGKDEELVGNRVSDAAYSVVYLNESEPLIEMIRETQSKKVGYTDTLCMGYLGNIYKPETRWALNRYAADGIDPVNGYRTDLVMLDEAGTPLTREFKPVLIASRAVTELESLVKRLESFEDNDGTVIATDITSEFFDITAVPKKVVKAKKVKGEEVAQTPPEPTEDELKYTLKPHMVVGLASIKVSVKHPYSKDENDTMELTLTLNQDIPERNSLKRLEDLEPKVHVITWAVSDKVFRYATVIHVSNGKGIWAGVYSNLHLVP